MTLRGRTTLNQNYNNVVYINVTNYNFDQRRNLIVYFNIDINNIRQRQNKIFTTLLKFPADLVIFTKEIRSGKLQFLCSTHIKKNDEKNISKVASFLKSL